MMYVTITTFNLLMIFVTILLVLIVRCEIKIRRFEKLFITFFEHDAEVDKTLADLLEFLEDIFDKAEEEAKERLSKMEVAENGAAVQE